MSNLHNIDWLLGRRFTADVRVSSIYVPPDGREPTVRLAVISPDTRAIIVETTLTEFRHLIEGGLLAEPLKGA